MLPTYVGVGSRGIRATNVQRRSLRFHSFYVGGCNTMDPYYAVAVSC